MDKITKPNDILVATIQAPNATTLDLLQNNINASNTGLLSPEEYKNTPLVKKAFTDENGVFNEEVFNNAYYQAYQKFNDLNDEDILKNIGNDLEHSPVDRFAPLSSKTREVSAQYGRLRNPMQRMYGIEGINKISESSKTREEIAQSNRIFDPTTGKFLDETPEDMSLLDKALGDTLIYAKWEEEGYHIDPITGQQVRHQKGEWKTDEDGNYYTEILGSRELKGNQVVNLQDILTKEDSMWNTLDFYDSDGKDKSAIGITTKLVMQIAPYFIPGVGGVYAAVKTVTGLASVLPTFYKSLNSAFFGENDSESYDAATRVENWFRKWEPSKSEEGRNSFMSYESLAGMVGDTVEQLFSQKTAAKAAEWFLKAPNLKNAKTLEDIYHVSEDYAKNYQKLASKLSLGYMGLTSAASTYNEALEAGYDRRTAGLTALVSAASMYGIMQYNATANNIGTWFLNKTTGFNPEAKTGAIRKLAKQYMKKFQDGLQQFDQGNKLPLKEAFNKYKLEAYNALDDLFVVGGSGVVGNSVLEGIEEVTEEVVQDAVKGMVDFASYMGWTAKKGSFGGWDNVFSKDGLSRYLETFVGGAIGGAVFQGAETLNNRIEGNLPERDEYDIYRAILAGKGNELKEELNKVKKFFPSNLSTNIVDVNGKQVFAPAIDYKNSQQSIIHDKALQMINTMENLILRESDNNKYDPKSEKYKYLVENFAENLKNTDLENIIFEEWAEDNIKLASSRKELQNLEKELSNTTEPSAKSDIQNKINNIKDNIKTAENELANWDNGKRFLEYNGMGLIMAEPTIAGNLNVDLRTYVKNIHDINYDDIEDSDKKEELKKEWVLHNQALTVDNKKEWRNIARNKWRAYQTISPKLTKKVYDLFKQKEVRDYLLYVQKGKDDTESHIGALSTDDFNVSFSIKEFLKANPKALSLNGRVKYNLADKLIDKGIITIDSSIFKDVDEDLDDEISKNEDPVEAVKNLINHIAAHSHIVVWDPSNIEALVNTVQEVLNSSTDAQSNIDLKIYKGRVKENTLLDLKLDKGKITDNEAMHVAFTSILDVVEDLDTIDNRTWNLLEQIYTQEKNEKQIQAIKNLINSKKTILEDTINSIETMFYINPTTWEVSDTPIEGYIDSDSFLDAQGGQDFTLAELFSVENVMKISSVEEGLKYINLLNYLSSKNPELAIPTEDVSLVPLELEEKYEKLKLKKSAVSKNEDGDPLISPLVDVVYDVMKDISKRKDINRSMVAWMMNKEKDLREGNLMFDSIDQEIISDFKKALDYVKTIVQMSVENVSEFEFEDQKSLPTTGLNSVIKNYTRLYGNLNGTLKKELEENFPIFEKDQANYLIHEINLLKDQAEFLEHANTASQQLDIAYDTARRETFNKRVAERLQAVKDLPLGNNKYTFPSQKEDEDDELYALRALQDLYYFMQANKIDSSDLHKALNGWLEQDTDYKGYYSEQVNLKDGTISDSLLREFILVHTALDPTELETHYTVGINGKVLSPLWDQEMLIKYTIANVINKEHFIEDGKNQPHLTHIEGSAGAGKSTIATVVNDALKHADLGLRVIISATSETKTKEFAEAMGEKDSSIVDKLIPNSIWSTTGTSSIIKIIDDLISTVKFTSDNSSPTLTGNIKVFNDLEVEFNIVFKDQVVQEVKFTDSAIEQILKYLDEHEYEHLKDTLYFIDESTYIDPLYVQLLNALHKRNIRVVTLGDPLQLGFTINLGKGLKGPFNLTHVYPNLLKGHRLNGIFRAQNTGIKENLASLGDLSKSVEKYSHPEFDYNEDVVKGEIDRFKDQHSLKYNNAFGHELTTDSTRLDALVERLPDAADVIFIYDDDTGLKALQEKFPKDKYKNARYLNIREVQGAEADYIVSYNIKTESPNDYSNSDIDIQKMYTLASRAKRYALIFEDAEGVFSRYGIKSVFDPTIQEITTEKSSAIWSKNLEARVSSLSSKIETLKQIENKYLKPEEGTGENTGEDNKDPNENQNDPKKPKKTDAEDKPVINSEKIERRIKEQEDLDLKDKYEDISEIFGCDKNDISLGYSSYLRFGISKTQTNTLKAWFNTTERTKILLQYLKGEEVPSVPEASKDWREFIYLFGSKEDKNKCFGITNGKVSKDAYNKGLYGNALELPSKTGIDCKLVQTLKKSNRDLGAFLKYIYPATTVSIQQVLYDFKGYLNAIKFIPDDDDNYVVIIKRRTDEDYWADKPNDNPEKGKSDGGAITVTAIEERVGDQVIYFTTGLLGTALQDEDKTQSTAQKNKVKEAQQRSEYTQEGVVYPVNKIDASKILDYYKYRQQQGQKLNINNLVGQFMGCGVASTGTNLYPIQENDSNKELLNEDQKKYLRAGKTTKEAVQIFGYELTQSKNYATKEEFLSDFNSYNFLQHNEVPVAYDDKADYYELKPHIYIPQGSKRVGKQSSIAWSRIIAPKSVYNGTLWEFLKNEATRSVTTANGHTTTPRVQLSMVTKIISFIKTIDWSGKDLSSKVKDDVFTELNITDNNLKKSINTFNDLLEILPYLEYDYTKNEHQHLNPKIIKSLNIILNALGYSGEIKYSEWFSYGTDYSGFLPESFDFLGGLLNTRESIGFAFTNDSSKSYINHLPESPRFYFIWNNLKKGESLEGLDESDQEKQTEEAKDIISQLLTITFDNNDKALKSLPELSNFTEEEKTLLISKAKQQLLSDIVSAYTLISDDAQNQEQLTQFLREITELLNNDFLDTVNEYFQGSEQIESVIENYKKEHNGQSYLEYENDIRAGLNESGINPTLIQTNWGVIEQKIKESYEKNIRPSLEEYINLAKGSNTPPKKSGLKALAGQNKKSEDSQQDKDANKNCNLN